jgi:hypothetical protein
MAYGTLKFDTLTTSDSVNTSTDKSLNTSYILNGVSKAWINFNGEGTIASRDSFNNSSITDNGTGDYSVTITNAMGNINFTHGGMGGSATNNLINISQNRNNYVPTTTVSRYALTYANTSSYDSLFVGSQLFGDLA